MKSQRVSANFLREKLGSPWAKFAFAVLALAWMTWAAKVAFGDAAGIVPISAEGMLTLSIAVTCFVGGVLVMLGLGAIWMRGLD